MIWHMLIYVFRKHFLVIPCSILEHGLMKEKIRVRGLYVGCNINWKFELLDYFDGPFFVVKLAIENRLGALAYSFFVIFFGEVEPGVDESPGVTNMLRDFGCAVVGFALQPLEHMTEFVG